MKTKTKTETFMVIRFFKDDHPRQIIKRGLTREEAVAHCKDPETSSSTCKGDQGRARTRRMGEWFDGYDREVR